MPQASDELRALVTKIVPGDHYGNLVDCGEAEAWLVMKGWRSSQNGLMWSPKPIGQVPREEHEVMLYLVHEWDYAYIGPIKD